MTKLGSPMRDVRAAALVSAFLSVGVFANSLANGFAYDDVHTVVNNTAIQSLATLPQAVVTPYWPIEEGQALALWRPLTTALLGIQYVLSGGQPLLFHATNVALHALVSSLLVLLVASVAPVSVAFLAGLVFAVHPVHTEAVANVVGVAELVSTAAVLGACLLHVRSGERSGWPRSLGIGALYAVGFGAKESAVVLPGLVFLLDAARARLGWRDLPDYVARRWRVHFVMLVVAVALLAARLEVLGGTLVPRAPGGAELLLTIPRIWTLGEIWTHYVRLWIFPLDLSADYSPNVIPVSFGWHAANVTGVALVLTVLVGALLAWRRGAMRPEASAARSAAFGVLWFGIAISPVSNIFFLSGVLLAERTLYLPTVGLAAATGWLAVRAWRHRPRMTTALVAGFLLFGTARTWVRNPTWRDTVTVFTTLIGDYPQSGRSQWALADSFLQQGRTSEALRAYRAAVDLLDSPYGLLTRVARTLTDLARYESADRILERLMRDAPDMPLAYRMRAGLRAELGDAAGAERYARASIALAGRDPVREHVLAWALASRGAWDEAVDVRSRADEVASVGFWQRWVYDAYVAQRQGDTLAVRSALDGAYEAVESPGGRAALDSIALHRFALPPREAQ
jgi:protein O-mannosyl-transferase